MPASFHQQRQIFEPGRDHFGLAQVNHYAHWSVEDFLLKPDRGRPDRNHGSYSLAYWVDRNLCAEQDRTIAALASTRAAGLADLRADETLACLEAGARDWRCRRLRALLADEAWRTLYGRLLMTPPSRLLSPDEAARLWALDPPAPLERRPS